MSLEVIKKIAAVEAESEKQRADAVLEAKKIVANAEAAGRALLQKTQTDTEELIRKTHREAELQGQAMAAEIAQQTKQICADLENAAATKMDAAVAIIVGRVVNG
jgi:V/A-type H+-transporting ATPase subunit G/H